MNDHLLAVTTPPQRREVLPDAAGLRVRLRMGEPDARELGEQLLTLRGTGRESRLLDQLWLRTVMIEEWRRTHRAEREAFEACADRLLAALDPST